MVGASWGPFLLQAARLRPAGASGSQEGGSGSRHQLCVIT